VNIAITVQDPKWIKQNKEELQASLPRTWTHMTNAKPEIEAGLKKLGVRWHAAQDFLLALASLTAVGLLVTNEKEPWLVRQDPKYFDFV
jgi:fructose-1-phosphate kinase PfkB-like protein